MATPDPYVPADIKRRVVNPGLFARAGAAPPRVLPQATESGVDTYPAVATTPTTSDAVNAIPRTSADPVFSERGGAQVPSPLDSGQALPQGVTRRSGTPGTNDVIYEGRGRFGERAFGNNQFNVDGRVRGVNPGLDALADTRSGEISRYVAAQDAARGAAAQAAAVAPANAKDYTDRIKAVSDIAAQDEKTKRERAAGVLDVQSKANANELADQFNLIAKEQGPEAAAYAVAASNLDPADPSLPASVRQGNTAIKQQLADLLNTARYGETPDTTQFGGGTITDAQALDPADYSVTRAGVFNTPVLVGPPDAQGLQRRRFISEAQARQFQPYTEQAARARRQKAKAKKP